MRFFLAALGLMLNFSAMPACAGEVFVGVYAHEVDTPFTLKSRENGFDIQLGFRGQQIEGLRVIGRPSPYIFGSLNSKGSTSFIAAGLSWTIGHGPVYFRPGFGLALHDGKIPRALAGRRYDLGSRILFEPEMGLGARVSEHISLEIQWTHISNARLLSRQNPGLDMIGVRGNLKF